MSEQSPAVAGARRRLRGRRYLTALVLTAVAGFVDIFAYLALYRVFVANMSGDSIYVGLQTAKHDWVQVFHRGLPVAAFVGGLLACSVVVEMAKRHAVRQMLALTLMVEALCLVAFLAFGARLLGGLPRPVSQPSSDTAALVALAAFAMGIQNASLRAAGVLNVYTTHVTGTLTRMAQRFVQFIFSLRGHSGSALRHPRLHQAINLAGLWVAYVLGAAAGGWSWLDVGFVAVWAPIGAIAITGIVAFLSPAPLP